MSFALTDLADAARQGTVITTSLVLEIDGYDQFFSVGDLFKYTRVGDVGLYVDGNWTIGGSSQKENVLNYVTWDGTSSAISQQLQQDKGGATSVTSIQISLIDKDELVTRLISPGVTLTDILGRGAYVYLGFGSTNFPEDYIVLFVGTIDEIISGATIVLNISNPEQHKRQDIFIKSENELSAAITDSQTTISLADATNFLTPVTGKLSTYVKINDEIIKYTGISTNDLTGCTRAQFGTIAAAADLADSASSWYRLQGTATQIALWIMLSGPDVYYKTGISISNFVRIYAGTDLANSMFFAGVDVESKYGLTVGDFVTTTGATSGSNNFSLRTVTSIDVSNEGSVVTVDGAALVSEIGTAATVSFSSQYNILPEGLGMGGHQVDVNEFNRVDSLMAGSILTYDFYLTDTVKGKDFLDKEVLYPSNLYSIPRKGKVSLGFVGPPLAIADLVTLNKDTLTRPEQIKGSRSLGKFFYNTVVYKYNYDAVETDKPLTGQIFIDEDSKTQIPVGTKAITIISKGMRNDAATNSAVDINSRRLLARYKNAAEIFKISGFFGTTFNVDVGDTVLFGDESMPIPDSKTGVRGFTPRLCEVIDKKMDIKTGMVSLSVVDTNYLVDGRYGIFSPSSIIGVGSTTSTLVITDSYNTAFPDIEKNKWQDYIGSNILIRNIDWSTTYNSKLLSFDPSNNYIMNISPIGASVSAGFIVDVAKYPDNADPDENRTLKSVFCFINPKVDVTAGTSDVLFSVGAGDISKFIVGNQIVLHDPTWTTVSPNVRISAVGATSVTVDTSLGFTPDSTYDVELIGFKDGGAAYRYL